MRNVILTGFMGTGKSSVGKLLATELGFRFRDLDEMIESIENLTINELFEKYGEGHFRSLEEAVVRSLSDAERVVLSTGGGAVISRKNRAVFRSIGCIVNLTASPEMIVERLEHDDRRPLLKGSKSRETIEKLMRARESFYADADIRIDTTGKKMEDVTREILLFLEGRD